jgi:class 3 adenylate cyclase
MMFVNQIADITHSMVDRYGGSANKNIGDAFLLVWKFEVQDDFTKYVKEGQQRKMSKQNQ